MAEDHQESHHAEKPSEPPAADRLPAVPITIVGIIVLLVVASWLPLVLIARGRAKHSQEPRIHLFQGMDNQAKHKAQATNPLFADNRAMRPPQIGTVARGELMEDDHYYRGRVADEWADSFPDEVDVDKQFVLRGQERFNIFCATCHGYDGQGQGMVHQRALELGSQGWIPPTNLHTGAVPGRPLGHLYNTITNGIRNMAPYGAQIPVEDRWAIVAYIKALQLSQNADLEAVPPEIRGSLQQ